MQRVFTSLHCFRSHSASLCLSVSMMIMHSSPSTSGKRLGLSYSFKWFWHTPNKRKEVQRVLRMDCPLSLEWWANNYYFVHEFCTTRIAPSLGSAFCSHDTQDKAYWSAIQELCSWSQRYKADRIPPDKRAQYWFGG
jgi:hypothetical protein